jgi:triacylglycerol lipase
MGPLLAIGCGGAPGADIGQSRQAISPSCNSAPYPIILAHGMAGFESIGPVNYFFNVAADLRSRGETVVEAHVPPFDSSADRATYLAPYIDNTLESTGACKVNIIAHSQGGVDSRYLISSMGYGDRIAGLVMVATPNLGSPVADVALGLVPGFSYDVINAILAALWSVTLPPGDPSLQASLVQLSRPNMINTFNPQNPDDSRVKYYSIAGRSNASLGTSDCAGSVWGNSDRIDLLQPLLAVTLPVWVGTSPDPLNPVVNDGLVSVQSARWGEFLGCEPADHLDEIGQLAHLFPDPISGFDHLAMYRDVVAVLHSDGF